MGQQFHLLWPERRMVDETQIRQWFEDAVANGEMGVGDATDFGLVDQAIEEDDAGLMAQALDEVGLITMRKVP